MKQNIYLVYLEQNEKTGYDSTVIAVFTNEEDAKIYVEFCKEDKQENEKFFYVPIELNQMKDLVGWYKLTKD